MKFNGKISVGATVTAIIFLVFAPTAVVFAQETGFDINEDVETEGEKAQNLPFFLFSEGAASSWLTRITFQSERSNFVFEDFLIGLYFRADLENVKYVKPMMQLVFYYPTISTFNDFPQMPNTPLHFAVDLTTGLRFDILDFKYFRLNFGPALHMFFLNTDRWNYFNLGAAAFLRMEVPLTRDWTFLAGGYASLDNGNLGANRQMEPFDIVYQYQIEAGVRYSKKISNRTFLFAKKPQTIEMGESFLLR